MKKLRWVEIDGMKYVGVEAEYHDCSSCVFTAYAPLEEYCEKIKTCKETNFVPLEVKHIPFLKARGKTKWQN